jgi:hypothetical protein
MCFANATRLIRPNDFTEADASADAMEVKNTTCSEESNVTLQNQKRPTTTQLGTQTEDV